MPATLYLRPSPRAFFLITLTHALVFRQPDASESRSSRSVVVAEFLPVEEVDMRGLIPASRRETVEGVLGVTSVPSDRSPIPEIFLILVSHSTPLSPFLPSSSLRPSKVVSVEFHSLSSSFWDPPDLLAASQPSQYDGYDLDDDLSHAHSGPYGSSTNTSAGSTIQSEAQKQGLENPCNGMRKYLESGGFFFAEGCKWDISSRLGSLTGTGESETTWVQAEHPSAHLHPLETFDERFVWNKSLLAPFLAFRSALPPEIKIALDQQNLLIPVIQGFCASRPITTGGWTTDGRPEVAALGLISRLSWKRAGARFRTRGIDDDGQVANFVETELILATESVCMDYVQVRGSVPLFWQQPSAGLQTLQQKVEITRPPQATQPAFDKHFLELLEHYHAVHAVNLLGQKDAESMLSAAYSDHLQKLKATLDQTPPSEKKALHAAENALELTPYDFHSAVRLNGHDSIKYDFSNRLREVSRSMDDFGWTAIDATSGQVIERQQGVFRVNCLDCLDRTNYIQDVISSITLSRFLSSIDSSLRSSSTLWSAHRELWADNGDRLSKIYAGTGAINTSATRSGKKTFAGLLSDATKSVGRAYINNFQDKGKQTSIDMLLGMMAGQRPVILFDPISDVVQSALRARSNEYSSTRNVTIFSGTWNLNGKPPDEALDAWLLPPNTPEPDVYMIAFQELVELTGGQIFQTDPAKRRIWEKFIMDTIEMRMGHKSEYVLFRSEQLVATALIVIVKSHLTNFIRNVESTTKKTGLQGLSGNKGGVGIRFDLYDSTICFVTSHLKAGQSAVAERNGDAKTLSGGMRFLRGKMIEDHDIIIWSADFNYRVALPNLEVREALENEDADSIERLLEADQLINAMNAGEAFVGYEEGPIRFRPTYKFDNGTETYDTSEKQRIPSWTDRILFKGDALRLKEYNRAELLTSDHRPVYAVFSTTIKEVDHIRKDAIAKEILRSVVQHTQGHTVDEKVERALRGGGGLNGLVKGMTSVDQRAPSPRLPPRPGTISTRTENFQPTNETDSTPGQGRHRSISNLNPSSSNSNSRPNGTTRSTSSSSLRTLSTGTGGGVRRVPPPVPARPNLTAVNANSTLADRPPSAASDRRINNNGSNDGSSTITPCSTGDTGEYVIVPPSTSIRNGSKRIAPPIPAALREKTTLSSMSTSPSTSTSTTTTATSTSISRISPRTPTPPFNASTDNVSQHPAARIRQSLDLDAPPPQGLMEPVTPDKVIPRGKSPSPSPFPSLSALPSANKVQTSSLEGDGGGERRKVSEISKLFESSSIGTTSIQGKPVPAIPRKPVRLRSASSSGTATGAGGAGGAGT